MKFNPNAPCNDKLCNLERSLQPLKGRKRDTEMKVFKSVIFVEFTSVYVIFGNQSALETKTKNKMLGERLKVLTVSVQKNNNKNAKFSVHWDDVGLVPFCKFPEVKCFLSFSAVKTPQLRMCAG